MKTILTINGPNLNLLGKREPSKYGTKNFDEYFKELQAEFAGQAQLKYLQSNHEGQLIEAIQQADGLDGVVLNAAAYTHSSIALADSIAAISTPVVEVHITNIYSREPFRHHSYISPVAAGCIAGLGLHGYHLAIQYLLKK